MIPGLPQDAQPNGIQLGLVVAIVVVVVGYVLLTISGINLGDYWRQAKLEFDTQGPRVADIVQPKPKDNGYAAGEELRFTVKFSEVVLAKGKFSIPIQIGTRQRMMEATVEDELEGEEIQFTYKVRAGDTDAGYGLIFDQPLPDDPERRQGTIFPVGEDSSIMDLAGNRLIPTFVMPEPDSDNPRPKVSIDALKPGIRSIRPNAYKEFEPKEEIEFTVIFTEPVTVSGTPLLPVIADNDKRLTARFDRRASQELVRRDNPESVTRFRSLKFKLVVPDNASARQGISIGFNMEMPGNASIKDLAGNEARTSIQPTKFRGVRFNLCGGTVEVLAETDKVIPIKIPPECDKIWVEAWGGGGGGGIGPGALGGGGAYAKGEFQLQRKGQQVFVRVGGGGRHHALPENGQRQPYIFPGAFNGGGLAAYGAGGGGGASDVRTNPNDINTRLIVAAGGGGSGAFANGPGAGGPGGDNIAGKDGGADAQCANSKGGGGGSYDENGEAGVWCGRITARQTRNRGSRPPFSSNGPTGGNGAVCVAAGGSACSGGGGGGGWYGGGGGSVNGGGGGGGSSFAPFPTKEEPEEEIAPQPVAEDPQDTEPERQRFFADRQEEPSPEPSPTPEATPEEEPSIEKNPNTLAGNGRKTAVTRHREIEFAEGEEWLFGFGGEPEEDGYRGLVIIRY